MRTETPKSSKNEKPESQTPTLSAFVGANGNLVKSTITENRFFSKRAA